MDAYEKLARWALLGDTGMSSKSIGARYLHTMPFWGYFSHPHDCGDFGRCYRLLEAMPQIEIEIMRGASPTWDKLVPMWPALVKQYEAELPADRWPEFHKLLNSVIR